jgi:hypothetical protein
MDFVTWLKNLYVVILFCLLIFVIGVWQFNNLHIQLARG